VTPLSRRSATPRLAISSRGNLSPKPQLRQLSKALEIFETGYRELNRTLWLLCESPDSDELFLINNWRAWQQMIAEVIQRLHDYTESGSAVVEQFSRPRLCPSQRNPPNPELDEEIRTSNQEIVPFLNELSDYCINHRSPPIGTTMTLVDMQRDLTTKRVTFDKQNLLKLEWSDKANSFLSQASASIDLAKTVEEYRTAIQDYCR
jgi:hypothetical protein